MKRRRPGFGKQTWAALAVVVAGSLGVACGGSDDEPAPSGTGGALQGTGGALAGTGGALAGTGAMPGAGAAGNSGGASANTGGAVSGGAPSVPAGQLTCNGKLCKGGGRCAADGSCPAFLGDCYSLNGGPQTCDLYCKNIGVACEDSGCYQDGSAAPTGGGYTYVTFDRAECSALQAPNLFGVDRCRTPIKPVPDGEQIRCCCRG
jgi:hypothetical protein